MASAPADQSTEPLLQSLHRICRSILRHIVDTSGARGHADATLWEIAVACGLTEDYAARGLIHLISFGVLACEPRPQDCAAGEPLRLTVLWEGVLALSEQFRRWGVQALREMPYAAYRASDHWKATRQAALERAGFTCALCRARSGLEVHHNAYERLGEEAPEDLVVLCRECHGRHHGVLA